MGLIRAEGKIDELCTLIIREAEHLALQVESGVFDVQKKPKFVSIPTATKKIKEIEEENVELRRSVKGHLEKNLKNLQGFLDKHLK